MKLDIIRLYERSYFYKRDFKRLFFVSKIYLLLINNKHESYSTKKVHFWRFNITPKVQK